MQPNQVFAPFTSGGRRGSGVSPRHTGIRRALLLCKRRRRLKVTGETPGLWSGLSLRRPVAVVLPRASCLLKRRQIERREIVFERLAPPDHLNLAVLLQQ